MDAPMTTTFFSLPPDLRAVVWGIYRKLVFEERCRSLEELLDRAKARCHVGVHASYSQCCMPLYDVRVHIDGPNGKIYCLSRRDKYCQSERRWATIREYMQYSEGYLEMHLDDSGGAWAPLYCPFGNNIKYRGRPENTENFR